MKKNCFSTKPFMAIVFAAAAIFAASFAGCDTAAGGYAGIGGVNLVITGISSEHNGVSVTAAVAGTIRVGGTDVALTYGGTAKVKNGKLTLQLKAVPGEVFGGNGAVTITTITLTASALSEDPITKTDLSVVFSSGVGTVGLSSLVTL